METFRVFLFIFKHFIFDPHRTGQVRAAAVRGLARVCGPGERDVARALAIKLQAAAAPPFFPRRPPRRFFLTRRLPRAAAFRGVRLSSCSVSGLESCWERGA